MNNRKPAEKRSILFENLVFLRKKKLLGLDCGTENWFSGLKNVAEKRKRFLRISEKNQSLRRTFISGTQAAAEKKAYLRNLCFNHQTQVIILDGL